MVSVFTVDIRATLSFLDNMETSLHLSDTSRYGYINPEKEMSENIFAVLYLYTQKNATHSFFSF